ncbi:hypothetical protein KGQ20_36075 [Catenulispora sp. NF23]|uniref:Peptidase S9 prolyl oligopeptidase catalytic domain-containing protein n=1 Tax=Catenulispora pinistramenti TaxID=2705254 RepID=A0ABS5L0B5_9ACTN|nr:hypothetical protein [Catenulispora pinistramenti]MBS2538184.1 hypothetical protein [Catenulispora pinistramenti]MBS2551595.1 hypothetical protein [Catenulispora pinistramenti]
MTELPEHLRPFLLDVPEVRRERVGRVDLYWPDPVAGGEQAADRLPAIVFVHGGPIPPDMTPTPRDWPTYVGYAGYVAGRGVVGVTVDHRLHDLEDYSQSAADVTEAIELVRNDPRVDGDRIAVWVFSGGGMLTAEWLSNPPSWLRCLAATYPVLAERPGRDADPRYRPAEAVRSAGELPIVLTRVGLERPDIAPTVEAFLAAADDCGAKVEVIDIPDAHHGFESIDHTESTRQGVVRAVESVLGQLRG